MMSDKRAYTGFPASKRIFPKQAFIPKLFFAEKMFYVP